MSLELFLMRSHCYCIPDYGKLTLQNVQSASQILDSLLASVNERKRSRGISLVGCSEEGENAHRSGTAQKSHSDKKTTPTMSRIDLLQNQQNRVLSYSQQANRVPLIGEANKRVKLYHDKHN